MQSRPIKAHWGGPVCCHCPNMCSGGTQGTVAARNMPFGLVRDGKRSEPLSLCPGDVTPGMLPSSIHPSIHPSCPHNGAALHGGVWNPRHGTASLCYPFPLLEAETNRESCLVEPLQLCRGALASGCWEHPFGMGHLVGLVLQKQNKRKKNAR